MQRRVQKFTPCEWTLSTIRPRYMKLRPQPSQNHVLADRKHGQPFAMHWPLVVIVDAAVLSNRRCRLSTVTLRPKSPVTGPTAIDDECQFTAFAETRKLVLAPLPFGAVYEVLENEVQV